MPNTIPGLLADVEDAEFKLGNTQHTFLRASGWTYTCETPGCYWMWQKKLADGRVIVVDVARAVTLEKHLMPEDSEADGEAAK
jgi:hypothetical protein